MTKKIKEKLCATDIAFLDPLRCDSLVGYNICDRNNYFEAKVELSDCNRHITWYFKEDSESLEKIQKAIDILSSFKKELTKHGKAFLKKEAEREARKAKKSTT